MKGAALVVIATIFLFSCSVKQVTEPKVERIFKDAEIRSSSGDNLPLEDIVRLEERVKTYWDARVMNDQQKMFLIEDPDIIKEEKLTLTSYIQFKSPAVLYNSYEVKGLEILSQEKVRVRISVEAFINIPQIMKNEKTVFYDIWQKKEGQWYRWFTVRPFDTVPRNQKITVPGNQKITIKPKPYQGLGSVPEGMPESGTKIEVTPTETAPPK
jgi:hypothetical protein